MKLKLITTALIFGLTVNITVRAQYYMAKFPFGIVTLNEVMAEKNDKFPDEDAIITFDMGNSYFEYEESGVYILFERYIRTKVITEAGIDHVLSEILLYHENNRDSESIIEIEGAVYNIKDGGLTKTTLQSSHLFDETVNEHYKRKRIAFPDLKPGSVVELRYIQKTPFLFNLPDWRFQSSVPTLHSQYSIRITPYYHYTFLMQGNIKFDETKSYEDKNNRRNFFGYDFNDMVYDFVMKDVPAFKSEKYLSSREDYIKKIDFQLSKIVRTNGTEQDIITTWEKANKELLSHESFGKYVAKVEKSYSKKLKSGEIESKSPEEDMEWAVNDIKKRFKWNRFTGKYSDKSVSEFEKNMEGSAAAINLYLVGVLRGMGYNADPLLISTRGNGKVHKNYPFLSFFDYTLCVVEREGEFTILDALDPNLPYDRIPEYCFNDNGLIIRETGPLWLNLSSGKKDFVNYNIILSRDNSGEFKGDINIKYSEYGAFKAHNKVRDNNERLKEFIETPVLKIVDDAKFEKPNPYTYVISAPASISVNEIEEKLYIDPFAGLGISDNPLNDKNRTYPVDFIHQIMSNFTVTIKIPEGYKIEYVPDTKKYDTSLFTFNFDKLSNENDLSLTFSYMFKKTEYGVQDFEKLKSYFTDIVNYSTEKVILVRE